LPGFSGQKGEPLDLAQRGGSPQWRPSGTVLTEVGTCLGTVKSSHLSVQQHRPSSHVVMVPWSVLAAFSPSFERAAWADYVF